MEMYPIFKFLEELNEHLTGNKRVVGNIIRKHSKKLEDLGDVSYPINVKNWSRAISKTKLENKVAYTIFDCSLTGQSLDVQLQSLINISQKWSLKIDKCTLKDESDVHLYLNRHYVTDLCIKHVLREGIKYGLEQKCFEKNIHIITDRVIDDDLTQINLTELRMVIIKNVSQNVIDALTFDHSKENCEITVALNSNEKQKRVLICGSVLNDAGVKDVKTTAAQLYRKRTLDMQLMAQHKYGMQVKPSWTEYFQKLGKASVTIEMLQNRSHKSAKITVNSLQTSSKGPSFIFYNCARISALLKQFEQKIVNKIYPLMPSVDKIDFALLNQPEEWEMVFVYVLQFPAVITSCISDVLLGVINLHNLVSFLSNLSSVFSVYYRRVKILTIEKEHLLPVLFARIHLIQAVQQIFHTALNLLDIEPIREM